LNADTLRFWLLLQFATGNFDISWRTAMITRALSVSEAVQIQKEKGQCIMDQKFYIFTNDNQ